MKDGTPKEPIMKVAVVAHSGKVLGGGLHELRQVLAEFGVREPMWAEVDKSRKAPKRVRAALEAGAELVLVWGGDGMVQQCVRELAGTNVPLAILPAGTANLLASNLGIPSDIAEAVKIALHGVRLQLDVATMNGEPFTVMGGAGFDGMMIADVDGTAKERLGRVAYVRSSIKAMSAPRTTAKIRIDGAPWFDGPASCVLVANVGTLIGGLKVFETASPKRPRRLTARAIHHGKEGRRPLRPQSPLRTRRRGPHQDTSPQDPHSARCPHRLRPSAATRPRPHRPMNANGHGYRADEALGTRRSKLIGRPGPGAELQP